MYVCMYVYVYVYVYAHIYACMLYFMCVYIYIYVYNCIHTYIRTYIHTCIPTYIYMYSYMPASCLPSGYVGFPFKPKYILCRYRDHTAKNSELNCSCKARRPQRPKTLGLLKTILNPQNLNS